MPTLFIGPPTTRTIIPRFKHRVSRLDRIGSAVWLPGFLLSYIFPILVVRDTHLLCTQKELILWVIYAWCWWSAVKIYSFCSKLVFGHFFFSLHKEISEAHERLCGRETSRLHFGDAPRHSSMHLKRWNRNARIGHKPYVVIPNIYTFSYAHTRNTKCI